MNPRPLSIWDQVVLILLRLLSAALGLMDSLFKVRWGEQLLARMASRWQAKLAEIDRSLAYLEQEREHLNTQVEAMGIHAAAIYLTSRSLARNELRFDPTDPHDEEILDATIDLLVKERLAAIETEEVEEGRYIYRLEPDWIAIRGRLDIAAEQAEPELAAWFRESVAFIDGSFLSETES